MTSRDWAASGAADPQRDRIASLISSAIRSLKLDLRGRVVVTEWPDALWFSNEGSFIPGSIETVLANQSAIHRYRNPCLTEAMVELGLIDTIGSGIRRMFRTQRERLFPLPDYEFGLSPRPSRSASTVGRSMPPSGGCSCPPWT